MYKTHSFQDVSISIAYKGRISSSAGAGVGSITVSGANDKTVHDVSSDGGVMISKIAGKNGTIVLQVQQVSAMNEFLLQWYRDVENGPSRDWAAMRVTVRHSDSSKSDTVCTGVSPQKRADITYQAQGQMVTWNLMAAEITQE